MFRSTAVLFAAFAAAIFGLAGFASTASAQNSVTLTPNDYNVDVGQIVEVELRINFTDPHFGGRIGVGYDDSLMSFDSFDFDPGLTANIARVDPPDGTTDNPVEVQFGWFGFPAPLGDTVIGTYRFLAESLGMDTVLFSTEITPTVFRDRFGNPLPVTYGSATINIVPEPSTALLIGLGLAAVASRRPRSDA